MAICCLGIYKCISGFLQTERKTKMKILIVEDDRVLNNGIALSFSNCEVMQDFCIKEAK